MNFLITEILKFCQMNPLSAKRIYDDDDESVSQQEMAEPPEFIKPLRDRTVPIGKDLEADIRVIGKPMPDICW